jgi:carboxymethylenebutenolidase
MMPRMLIQFARPDGKTCPAYLASPAGGDDKPGIVVIQEYWGLNEQIKRTADRFAAAGYRALVPDLFRGKIAANANEASHLMSDLNFPDAASQDVRGAVQFLKASSPKVAVGGFCMGGALTIISAAKVPGVDAGICFYGIPPVQAGDPAAISVPMQYHFANRDDWCTKDKVDDLEARTKAAPSEHALYRYEAQHAFMNEARPEVYDAACAGLAWERALEFLKRTIG